MVPAGALAPGADGAWANAPGGPGLLIIGGQQLAPFVHTPGGRALLAMPGQNVHFNHGKFTVGQLFQHRPSYINALLIQSRGILCTDCAYCAAPRTMPVFLECRRVPGHFGGCCGNCKWPDKAVRCSYHSNNNPDGGGHTIDLTGDDNNDNPPGATAQNAITL